jgi:hypothetical protein
LYVEYIVGFNTSRRVILARIVTLMGEMTSVSKLKYK